MYLKERAEAIAWLLSAVNVLEVALPPGHRHRVKATRLPPAANDTLFPDRLAAIFGILKSAAAEWTAGMINTLEFHFVAMAFEDFLRHAAVYNESGRRMEAAVLASAVLEDTVSRLCRKHNVDSEGKSLGTLIAALKARQVLGKVKAERIRSYATIRNHAFHAQWEGIDTRDLRQMIEGLEEIIESHFA